jgi:hypothetical protein
LLLADYKQGMFLWVRLVISMLEHAYTPKEVQQALDDLPEGLDKVDVGSEQLCSVLTALLVTIGSNKDRASRIFQWLACSQRPLKKFEAQYAVALHFDNPKINVDTSVFADVFELCKPLIESGASDTIRFVHVSVKEFAEHYLDESSPLLTTLDTSSGTSLFSTWKMHTVTSPLLA